MSSGPNKPNPAMPYIQLVIFLAIIVPLILTIFFVGIGIANTVRVIGLNISQTNNTNAHGFYQDLQRSPNSLIAFYLGILALLVMSAVAFIFYAYIVSIRRG